MPLVVLIEARPQEVLFKCEGPINILFAAGGQSRVDIRPTTLHLIVNLFALRLVRRIAYAVGLNIARLLR